MKKYFLFILIVAFLASCKSTQPSGGTSDLKSRSAKRVLSKLQKNEVEAEWMNSKAKLLFEAGSDREKATAYIRMQKGKQIWISLRRLNIEGIRVLITPDSITVLNKLERWYSQLPFDRIQKDYNLPFGFDGLQEVLLGNPVFLEDRMKGRAGIKKASYLLEQEVAALKSKYYVEGQQFLLQSMNFFDTKENREVNFKQEKYKKLEGDVLFSYFRKIQMYSRQTGKLSLELDFSKVVLNEEKSMRFEIPAHYKKVD